jgi:hypothetical protein
MGLGSRIREQKNLFRIPDPGVKKAPDPGSGSATLVTLINNIALYGGNSIIQTILKTNGTTIPFMK